jgi:SpoVK/Ycf46/Vps4 family AAA+-type ATPase
VTFTQQPFLWDLLPQLKRLDRLLERAVAIAQVVYGIKAAADPFRGLHISESEVEQLLAREPGAPFLKESGADEVAPETSSEDSRLSWLARTFSLTPFEVDVILLALAPELDLRYERLYAYLQDDVTRRRPSIDLALNLLCSSAAAKLANRVYFAPEAAPIRHHLIHLLADPNQPQAPLLAHYLKLDDQIVSLLLGQDSLDPRLAAFCQVIEPAVSLQELLLAADVQHALPVLANQAQEIHRPLQLYFHGPRGAGKRRAAEALAGALGVRLLAVDLVRALTVEMDFAKLLRLIFREAWFQDLVLYLDGLDVLRCEERAVPYQRLLEVLVEDSGITILAGTQPWTPPGHGLMGVLVVPFAIPEFAQRRASWEASLAARGVALDVDDINALADRFRLMPEQIADAIATACNHNVWRMAASEQAATTDSQLPLLDDLFAAARSQSSQDLGMMADKIEPKYTWEDIVLPEEVLAQLREICQRLTYRHRVLDEWGFERKLSRGKGVNALFPGPSGTGKTMAAEIIANQLGLDLYKIDLSAVVSKYIGETEKNLGRVFTAAENANAILFFDEADALFGKRSEVRDAHDRYANIEIAYLLQKMEQYDGLAILASNLRQNMDEAFLRRLQFIVEFPFPDETQRYRIWQVHFPPEVPKDKAIDYNFLARQFRLSGGNIKNIVLQAAFLGAANGGQIDMDQLIRATWREYQKLGRVPSESEFGKYGGVLQ